jgi:signal transduction histidine kinase
MHRRCFHSDSWLLASLTSIASIASILISALAVCPAFAQPALRDSLLGHITDYTLRRQIHDSSYARLLLVSISSGAFTLAESEKLFRQAKPIVDSLTNPKRTSKPDQRLLADWHSALGISLRWTKHADSATALMKLAIAEHTRLGIFDRAAFTCSRLALMFHHRGFYKTALQYHLRSLELAERGASKDIIFRQTVNTSDLYNNINKPREALSILSRSQSIIAAQPTTLQLSVWHANKAMAHLLLHEIDSARRCVDVAIRYSWEMNDSLRVVDNFLTLATIELHEKKYAQGAAVLDSAIVLERSFAGTALGRFQTNTLAARLQSAWGHDPAVPASERAARNQAALRFVRRAAQQINDNRIFRLRFYTTQAEVYAGVNMFDSAYTAQQRAARLRDSIFDAEFTSEMTELRERYEVEKREQQITKLQGENASKTALGYVLALVAAFLLAASVVAVSRYRLKKRSEEQLQAIEAQLRQRNSELEMLNNEKGEILGVVSHDLKNPLTGIAGLADLIRIHGDTLPLNEIQDAASEIRSATERAFTMISSLLDAYRTDITLQTRELLPTDVRLVLERLVEENRLTALRKDITLLLDVGASEQTAVPQHFLALADAQILNHVVENLLSNAIKFSPKGKRIWLRASNNATHVTIAVQDEGPGLSDNDKQQIFGKFVRLSARPTAGESSMGLGLSIVKKLTELMGGRVWCESETGDGTRTGATFFVELQATPTQVSAHVSAHVSAQMPTLGTANSLNSLSNYQNQDGVQREEKNLQSL